MYLKMQAQKKLKQEGMFIVIHALAHGTRACQMIS